jgi:methylmalonyl-CoA mutase cobalamin-binding domain/chain
MNLDEITQSLIRLDAKRVCNLVQEAISHNVSALAILDALDKGLEKIGEKYENAEYFLSELIMGGEIMKEVMQILTPHLGMERSVVKEPVVIGTIEGDLHDIGKNIVVTLLQAAGLKVYDLGIDVSPKKFVEVAKKVRAKIIGVSALLSTSVPRVENIVEELEREGLRKKVKVIIGGAAARREHIKKFGVDAAVNDAVEGVNIIKKWIEGDFCEAKR